MTGPTTRERDQADLENGARDIVMMLLHERDRQYNMRFEMVEEAVKVALSALDKRLDAMNEFRQQVSDQARQYLPRSEYNAVHQLLVQRVEILNEQVQINSGARSGAQTMWGYIMGIAGVVVAALTVVATIWHHG